MLRNLAFQKRAAKTTGTGRTYTSGKLASMEVLNRWHVIPESRTAIAIVDFKMPIQCPDLHLFITALPRVHSIEYSQSLPGHRLLLFLFPSGSVSWFTAAAKVAQCSYAGCWIGISQVIQWGLKSTALHQAMAWWFKFPKSTMLWPGKYLSFTYRTSCSTLPFVCSSITQ